MQNDNSIPEVSAPEKAILKQLVCKHKMCSL